MDSRGRAGRRGRARTYPVLGYTAIAAALAVLLPSGLSLPNSGPPTVAEYAPVPGQGQGNSDQGSLGAAGNGLGAGTGTGESQGPGPTPTPDPFNPVGGGHSDPPPNGFYCVKQSDGIYHQTADPLSPPCVTYVPADNGGSTGAPGVTGDAIVAVMNVDWGGTGNQGPKHLTDCTQGIDTSTDNVDDQLCKGYWKFFQTHYNTYKRKVHLYANHGLGPADVIEQVHPFALISPLGSASALEISKTGGIAIGFSGSDRATYQKYAPHLMSFWPDTEDRVALTASYICRKLGKDRPASFTPDPLLAGKPRKYAFWTHEQTPTTSDQMLMDLIKKQCGIEIVDRGYGISQPAAQAIVKMKNDGITTVIFQEDNGSPEFATNYAHGVQWYPEWVIPGQPFIRAINTNFYGRLAQQTEWSNAVGITFDYRRDAPHDQPWYRAYRQGCGSTCPEPTLTGGSAAPTQYDTLQMFFTAVQLGGPRLTAESVDRGLHAIPEIGSPNPYRPAAYFAPGNYTFVKDATAIWWDPQGRPPGESTTGCYRLVGGGKRSRAGEWPEGDEDITHNPSDPCQGDTFNGG